MASRVTGEIVATDRDDALTEEVEAPGSFDAADELRPGERIGRYHILEPIGRGGMGAVYAAYDPGLERRIALKVLHRAKQRSSALQERLVREAKAMARLSHPNVVAVHEVGMHRDCVFLAMEFVSGKTIRAWLRETTRSWREVSCDVVDVRGCADPRRPHELPSIAHGRDLAAGALVAMAARSGRALGREPTGRQQSARPRRRDAARIIRAGRRRSAPEDQPTRDPAPRHGIMISRFRLTVLPVCLRA